MSSELVAKNLDKAAGEALELTRNVASSFSGALNLARVVSRIREALTPELVKEAIMPLMGTQFGWKADKKDYTLEQVRDVWVSACMVGAKPVNNEVNIISGQMYLAKNYFKRILREYPGLTEFNPIPGNVKGMSGGALVDYTATWKLDGKPMKRERVGPSAIPVRLVGNMGADAALGKAERKFLCDVLSYITGTQFNDGEIGDDEPIASVASGTVSASVVQPTPQSLPAPKKTTPTQTQAVTEKLKKTVAVTPPVAETPAATEEKMPWDGDSQPIGGDDEPPSDAVVDETQATPAVPAAPAAPAPVPEAKKSEASKPAQQKPAAQQSKPQSTPPPTPLEPTSDDVIEKDTIGQIAAIKATKPGGVAPYTIMSDNGTQYITMDRKMAEKAKGYKETNVPVAIEYTVQESGKHMIVDVLPAELAGDPGDFGAESPGDQEPA